MKIYKYPTQDTWKNRKTSCFRTKEISGLIAEIFAEVGEKGDQALIEFNKKFDKADTQSISVTKDEIENAEKQIKDELKQAIQQAKENIENFTPHKSRKLKN
jgi:histidinol dehydrogenase